MEYVYAALILNETGEEINEDNVTGVLEAAGVDVEESRVKALVAALEDVDIEEAIETAAAAPRRRRRRGRLRGRRGRRRGRRRERRRGRRRRGSGGRRGRGRRRRRGPRRALRLTPDDSRDFDRVDRLSNIRFLLNFAIRVITSSTSLYTDLGNGEVMKIVDGDKVECDRCESVFPIEDVSLLEKETNRDYERVLCEECLCRRRSAEGVHAPSGHQSSRRVSREAGNPYRSQSATLRPGRSESA